MVATTGLPGSQDFGFFVGTLAHCREWVERQLNVFANTQGRTPSTRIVSNREAATWRYRDGRKVVDLDNLDRGEF